MKIALVLDDTLDTPDGVQQYVLKVGAWLTNTGHEVHYLVGHTTRRDIPNIQSLSRNVHVSFNGNRMSIPLPASRSKLRKLVATEVFDIVHVQVPYSPFLAGRLLRTLPANTAAVGTFHILPYSRVARLANRGLALLNRRSGRRFDVMTAVSSPAAVFAQDVYGYNSQVVPNPIDLAQFSGVSSSNNVTTNIVFLGRLVARKGAAHLLAAVAYLYERKQLADTVRVHIGGKGELQDQLMAYVRQHDLANIVSFAGFIDEAHKASFLAQADIAVYPSVGGESFGIVLLEGMAAARGVVLAGNNPGYASVMPDDSQLVDPSNVVSFAAILHHWLTAPDKRKSAATRQHEYVQKFDSSVVGAQLEAIYQKALQSRRES